MYNRKLQNKNIIQEEDHIVTIWFPSKSVNYSDIKAPSSSFTHRQTMEVKDSKV